MALRDMVLQMSKNRKIAAMLFYIIENTENNNIFTDVERVNEEDEEEDEDEDQDYKVSVSLLGDDIEILENMKQKLRTIFLYFKVEDLSYQPEVNMFTFIISNQSVLYLALVYKELLMIYENIIQEEGFDPLFGKKCNLDIRSFFDQHALKSLKYDDEVFTFNDTDGTVFQLIKLVKICYPHADITYISQEDMHNMPETKIKGITFETMK
jgi:hypothetical protein